MGNGKQSRTFMYIDDAIEATREFMKSGSIEPVNIGSDQLIEINTLVDMLRVISGKDIIVKNVPGIVGMKDRSSNNMIFNSLTSWKPNYSLHEGLSISYKWVVDELS